MERKRKKSKKKILIISLVIVFIVLLLVLAYFLIFKRDIFTYKNKITIEVGDTIPSVKDYLYKDNDKVKEITWKETFSEDNKIYKPGTYKGTFTYKGEEKEVTLKRIEDRKKTSVAYRKLIENEINYNYLDKDKILRKVK